MCPVWYNTDGCDTKQEVKDLKRIWSDFDMLNYRRPQSPLSCHVINPRSTREPLPDHRP